MVGRRSSLKETFCEPMQGPLASQLVHCLPINISCPGIMRADDYCQLEVMYGEGSTSIMEVKKGRQHVRLRLCKSLGQPTLTLSVSQGYTGVTILHHKFNGSLPVKRELVTQITCQPSATSAKVYPDAWLRLFIGARGKGCVSRTPSITLVVSAFFPLFLSSQILSDMRISCSIFMNSPTARC